MSNQPQVTLAPLEPDDKEQFILDNQLAFKYGATEEFGVRDDHFEEDGEIISRDTIEQSINNGKAYRILLDGEKGRRRGSLRRCIPTRNPRSGGTLGWFIKTSAA